MSTVQCNPLISGDELDLAELLSLKQEKESAIHDFLKFLEEIPWREYETMPDLVWMREELLFAHIDTKNTIAKLSQKLFLKDRLRLKLGLSVNWWEEEILLLDT